MKKTVLHSSDHRTPDFDFWSLAVAERPLRNAACGRYVVPAKYPVVDEGRTLSCQYLSLHVSRKYSEDELASSHWIDSSMYRELNCNNDAGFVVGIVTC